MTYIIPNPQSKAIKQLNVNDLLGDVYSSKNIDLSDIGHIKLSHRPISVMSKDEDSDFNNADSLTKSPNGIFVGGNHLFSGSVGLNVLTDRNTDTNPPAGGVEEDLVYFNATEVASDGTGIKYRSASTVWTTVAMSLDNSNPTQMAVSDAFNSLVVGNKNLVKLVDTTWVVGLTLTLPAQYQVTSLDVNNNSIAIGTRNIAGGEAKLFIWDGSSSAYSGSYGVKTTEIFSVKSYGSSFALVTSKGKLLQFNGGGFTELGSLPVAYFNANWADASNDHSGVSNRGMVVSGDSIFIRVNPKISGNSRLYFSQYFQGGLWRYDEHSGLNCVLTPSMTKWSGNTIATSSVNTSTDVITVSSSPVTGTPTQYYATGGSVIGGLEDNKVYYTIKLTGTTIKLASTYSDAIAGTAIDLTSTGNSFQILNFFLVTDYGWSYSFDRGAVEILSSILATNSFTTDKEIFTANLFGKQSQTSITTFNIVHPLLKNIGYFVTPKLSSSSLTEKYDTISLKYKPLKTDDKIIVKYRLGSRIGLPFGSFSTGTPITGVWSDTSTFTTTVDMTNYKVGDEVEIVAGVGAGWMAHITSCTDNAGTWTVVLDSSFIYASANDIMYFCVDNWSVLKTITKDNETGANFDETGLQETSKVIQLKVVLDGHEIDIEQLTVKNSTAKS